jgi:hypothetical protein
MTEHIYKPASAKLTPAAIAALDIVERSVHDGWHHLFAIPALLQTLGLSDWAVRLFQFLSLYDGVEALLDGEVEPATLTRQLLVAEVLHLNEAGGGNPLEIKARVSQALSESDFAAYGGGWYPQTGLSEPVYAVIWKPLEQSLLEFLEDAPELIDCYMLTIMCGSRFAATPLDIQRFLLH